MTKTQFLDRIKAGISSLPREDKEKYLEYYSEMVDDRMEEGMTEEEAVADIGSTSDIVAQILREGSSQSQAQNQEKPISDKLKDNIDSDARPWIIAAVVLTSPVWVPILFGLASGLIGIAAGVFSAIAAFYASAVGVFAAGVACIVKAFFVTLAGETVAYVGAGLLCMGISLLLFLLGNLCIKLTVKLIKLTVNFVKSKLGKKKEGTR